jgi:hypothetical protein
MAVDYIRYDILTQEALRGVVRTVLVDAAVNGLPGDHHFFITVDTNADDVKISTRLKAQYPEEITIVLQHQFWDLRVTERGFEVGLSFNGISEKLAVPFAAITRFLDPSVQFGLQFSVLTDEAEAAAPGTGPSPDKPAAAIAPAAAAATTTPPDDKPPEGGAEVVRLDRFRKK